LPDDVNATVLLTYLETWAGLLIARREGVYAFPHRSFQEYLAACHLANTEREFAAKLRDLVWQDPAWWREVFLLGVGKKRQGGLGDAVNVINTLVPDEPERVSPITETHWRAVVLAGQASLDLRLPQEVSGRPYHRATLDRVCRWLAALVQDGHLPAAERLVAGDVLGRLGDPRRGVGIIPATSAAPTTILPDVDWVEIPAGPFTMGSGQDDKMAWDDERPAHTLDMAAFWIGRYPITNAQYQPFVEGGGYDRADYWSVEGWAWRQGAAADLSPIDDDELRKNYEGWLAGRPAERRDRPFWWDDPKWSAPTRPVVGITWYEALAYCRWLDGILRAGDRFPFPVGHVLQLPSEAEWEKAARGAQGLRWPWANTWQEGAANTKEANLGQTSPVGMFPAGVSPYGVHDLSGNVWEWTRSRWGHTTHRKPDYQYPYVASDGREDLSGSDLRILRGGSWYNEQRSVRCGSRRGYFPGYFSYGRGLRVVVSLANSEF
jgi:formylglycine-generating enzyme required for sulfatase activity